MTGSGITCQISVAAFVLMIFFVTCSIHSQACKVDVCLTSEITPLEKSDRREFLRCVFMKWKKFP